jgi:hypothetical protein
MVLRGIYAEKDLLRMYVMEEPAIPDNERSVTGDIETLILCSRTQAQTLSIANFSH